MVLGLSLAATQTYSSPYILGLNAPAADGRICFLYMHDELCCHFYLL